MGHVHVVLRPVASPLALGFYGVAGSSLTLSGLELGWIPHSEQVEVGLIVVLFTALPQFVGALIAFFARDPLAATTMGVLAAAWGVDGMVLAVAAPSSTTSALGTVLLVAGLAALVSAAQAASVKLVQAAVVAATGSRFVLTAIYQLDGGAGIRTASGVAGLVVTAIAIYAAAALGLEEAKHRAVLPTGRRSEGAKAMTGDLLRQTEDVTREAGVRSGL